MKTTHLTDFVFDPRSGFLNEALLAQIEAALSGDSGSRSCNVYALEAAVEIHFFRPDTKDERCQVTVFYRQKDIRGRANAPYPRMDLVDRYRSSLYEIPASLTMAAE